MYYVVTELNGKYAFVVAKAQLRLGWRTVGSYPTRVFAQRVALYYNRRQRAKLPGRIEVLWAYACWLKSEELRCGCSWLKDFPDVLGLAPYQPSGYFDLSTVFAPADRV